MSRSAYSAQPSEHALTPPRLVWYNESWDDR